jgi:predicted transcriptional regulator
VEPDQKKLNDKSFDQVLDAVRNGYNGEYITFSTPQQLFAALPPKRWVLIEKLQQLGPSSLRGLARAVGRDVKRVHEDVAALLDDGIIERNEQKKLFVPFASVRIEFSLFGSKAA